MGLRVVSVFCKCVMARHTSSTLYAMVFAAAYVPVVHNPGRRARALGARGSAARDPGGLRGPHRPGVAPCGPRRAARSPPQRAAGESTTPPAATSPRAP
eukprot:scaffold7855_cov444-Prasinococcus_capsulatus_cf.AAC.1